MTTNIETSKNENPARRPVATIQLKPGAHVHMMGICGTAMASLAGLLKDRGYRVTGSDQNVYPPMSTQLKNMGIKIMEGYKRENLQPRPDLVIVGNVISRQIEEAQALLESDIPFTSLPSAMGQIVIADRHSMVISGTHGKTTTTSLTSWLTDCLGLKPGFMIGGIPKNFGQSYRVVKASTSLSKGMSTTRRSSIKCPSLLTTGHARSSSPVLNLIMPISTVILSM